MKWTKGALSSTYKLFEQGRQVGYLHDKTFKQKSEGEIRGKKCLFRTQGLFKQQTQIIDLHTDQQIGSIQYNSWMNKAEIKLHNNSYHWKYDNGWQTRWSITDERGLSLRFAGGMTKGKLEGDIPDDLLVLSGLFVTNYYTQAGIAVLVAVFIPIWVSVIN